MGTFAKYFSIAILATVLLYCLNSANHGNPGDGSVIADARAQDAHVNGACEPCLRRTVYSGILDANGMFCVQLSNFDPNDMPIIDSYLSYTDGQQTVWWGGTTFPSISQSGEVCLDRSALNEQGKPVRLVVIR